jgi:hypothetical protein
MVELIIIISTDKRQRELSKLANTTGQPLYKTWIRRTQMVALFLLIIDLYISIQMQFKNKIFLRISAKHLLYGV